MQNLRDRVTALQQLSPEQQTLFNMNDCFYCAGIGTAFHFTSVCFWETDFGVIGTAESDYLFHCSLGASWQPYSFEQPCGRAGIAEFADRVENVIQYHLSLEEA